MVVQSCRRLSIVLTATVALLAAGCDTGTETPKVLASIYIAPTPSPSPKPLTVGQAALEAFVKRVTSGKLTYHATLKGDAVGAVTGLRLSGGIDVGGNDYAESVTFVFPTPPNVAVGVRAVGGRKWVRFASGPWQKISAARSNSPFAGISKVADVKLLGTERVAGRNHHHLEFPGGEIIAPDQIPAINLTDETVNTTSTELVVDDDGIPLTATWRLEGLGRVSAQLQGLRVDLALSFSKVGSKMAIKAP